MDNLIQYLNIYKTPIKKLEYIRQWRKDNPGKPREYQRRSRVKHKEKNAEYHKIWQKKNIEKRRIYKREWSKKHRAQIRSRSREIQKERYKTVKGKLDSRMGTDIYKALCGRKSGRSWESLVGYGVDELTKHIESLFTGGMCWEHYLQGKIHIDHIVPKIRFYYKKPEDLEFKVCWGLANLQPLWAQDNLSKNRKTMDEWKQKKR